MIGDFDCGLAALGFCKTEFIVTWKRALVKTGIFPIVFYVNSFSCKGAVTTFTIP